MLKGENMLSNEDASASSHERLRRLCAAAALTALAACGGGGGEGQAEAATPAAAAPTTAPASPWAGSAYLQTRLSLRDAGGQPAASPGLSLLLAACNHDRLWYELPEQTLPANVLADSSAIIETRVFDTDRAATYEDSNFVELIDHGRWKAEFEANTRAGVGFPAVPPDCTIHRLVPLRAVKLWLEGIQYRLNFKDRTAVNELSAGGAFTPRTLSTPAEFEALPSDLFTAGERCRVISGSGATALGFGGTSSVCVWDRFPHAVYLNWPWAVSGSVTVQGATSSGGMRVELIDARRELRPEDREMLRVPDGFTVTIRS
jgi:hypothetical protein